MKATTLNIARALSFVAAVWICFGHNNLRIVEGAPRVIEHSASTDLAPADGSGGTVKVGVDLVLVPVTVTDRRGHLVLGLQKDSFNVFDQGKPEVIRHLSSEDAPISVGIIFDASGSMYGKMERSREAVLQFLHSSNPEDEFFLVAFNDRPELLVDFTSSIDEIQDEISKVKPDGGTALLDALYLGLDRIKKARNERKVLLVVSDGGDNHSRYTAKEVWPVLREADVQIYAMGIFDEAPRTQAERLGPDLLAFATGITGGRTFPIRNLKRVGDAAAELSIELRNQYLVAYCPNNLAHDGMWHKLTVRVTPPQNLPRLRVYAKVGYYAPAR
ncbi:MAG TPA: VWA domain-containing protein [Candidatus Eremiobacteraceae bacterium]|nr:VWA domain-containing protein [Candidatus Eremiobacteraceae bacterium]